MAFYYSASERAFFSSELMSVDAMPADRVSVTDSAYKQLMADQVAGKLIRTGSGNAPESVDQGLAAATRFGDVSFGKVTSTSIDLNGSGDVSGSWTVHGVLNAQGGLTVTDITATGTTTVVGLNAGNIAASGTLAVNGATTLTGKLTANGGISTKAFTAMGLDLNGNGDVSGTLSVHGKTTLEDVQTNGDLTVGGLLQVTGSTATVGGKQVVLSVNGTNSDSSGNVQLGSDVVQYKTLTSIQSVAGTFWFDYKSGIPEEDWPTSGDWAGIQIGTMNGHDKAQFIFNGYQCFFRYDDNVLGNEKWTKDSWVNYDLRDLAKDSAVVHNTGDETINGTKTFVATIKGNVETANSLKSAGQVTALEGVAIGISTGIQMYEVYRNGYPVSYGNVIHLRGTRNAAGGESELLLGWSGTSGAFEKSYIRSRRDTADANWSEWSQIYTDKDFLLEHAILYKSSLSSLQSVSGSFWFDSNSGIDTTEAGGRAP